MLVLFQFLHGCGRPVALLVLLNLIVLAISYVRNDGVHHDLVALVDI
jgi:hypothetical protein